MDHLPPLHRGRAALAAVASVLLLASCSLDDREAYPHVGESGGWTAGSVVRTVLLYVLVPVGLCALISLLAWLPGAARRFRYRPQEGWTAEPVWFAGPSDPVQAVEQAQTGDVVRGGAGGSW
ncbi:MAG TPA: hypothetical protein VNU26_08905 [Mycobacteriales bacterium]|nr:hypothetical protein [Mycobacteriales bacterium]